MEMMKDDSYRVTAIVSTYNSEAFMEECLTDLVHQTIADDLEIIIVDAASEENEKAIIEGFQKRYDNITYLRTGKRILIYKAWNMAIQLSRGHYITPFSTNDRLRKDAYEMMAKRLDENPDVSLVYGDTYLTETPHETFEHHQLSGTFQWPDFTYEDLLKNCRVGPHPMWRRAIHEEIGYFDESFVAIGDQEFWLRMGETHQLLHLPEYTGLYWVTDDALSRKGDIPLQEIGRVHQKYQRRYVNRILPASRPIFIWGAGDGGLRTLGMLSAYEIQVAGFIDNDRNKWETLFNGLKVYPPSFVKEGQRSMPIPYVVIGSGYASEIATQLIEFGFKERDDFWINCLL